MRLFRHIFVLKLCLVFILAAALFLLLAPKPALQVALKSQSLAGVTVFVDAGHGGYDGGSRAKESGIWEKEINLAVALKTRQALVAHGATVLMAREEDVDLCDDNLKGITKKRQDLKRRLEIAQTRQAQFVLSIHMNEYRSRSESGPHVFYRKGQDDSRLLAGCMQAALIEAVKPKRERVAQSGDYFMLSLDVPSVLIECGFISNAAEEKLLLTDAYQDTLADAIVTGLLSYLELTSRQGAGMV